MESGSAGLLTPPLQEWSDRYEVAQRPFVQGGMGALWFARDVDLGRDVAVKSIRPELAGKADLFDRFVRETKILGRLDHPGICPIHDCFLFESIPCYTMKVIRGRTITEWVRDQDAAAEDAGTARQQRMDRVQVAMRICETLHYAHSQGIIHRDLKPDNVIIGEFGDVYVMDWGLARVLGDREPVPSGAGIGSVGESDSDVFEIAASRHRESQETSIPTAASLPGSILGTPRFMPPEFARGHGHEATVRSDVFGLGALLQYLLAGRSPFTGSTEAAIKQARRGKPAIATEDAAGRPLDREIVGIVTKAMAGDPLDRYPTAAALRSDLQAWLANERVSAVRYTAYHRILKWAQRRPMRLLIAGSVLLIASITMIAAILVDEQADAAREADFLAAKAADERALAEQRQAEIARQARYREQLQSGQISELLDELGGRIDSESSESVERFMEDVFEAMFSEHLVGTTNVLDELDAEQVAEYRRQFDRYFSLHDQWGDRIPVTADMYIARAHLLINHKDFSGAADDAKTALALDTNHSAAWFMYAIARKAMGQQADVIEEMRAAVETMPDNRFLRFALAETLWDAGQENESRDEYIASIEPVDGTTPTNTVHWIRWFEVVRANVRLARIAYKRNEIDAALTYIRAADRTLRDNSGDEPTQLHRMVWNEWALIYVSQGEFDQVIELLDPVIRERPDDAEDNVPYKEMVSMYASSLHQVGRYDDGFEWAERRLEMGPKDRNMYLMRAAYYRMHDNYEEALREAEFGLRYAADTALAKSALMRDVLRTMQFITIVDRVGSLGSLELLNSIVQQLPEEPDAWIERGVTHLALDNFHQAIADLDQAIQLRTPHLAVHAFKAQALMLLGLFDEAEAEIDAVYDQMQPSNQAKADQIRATIAHLRAQAERDESAEAGE